MDKKISTYQRKQDFYIYNLYLFNALVKQVIHPEQLMEKEHIYPEQDVLTHPYHIELRKDTIYLAMVLGNNYGKKVQMQVHTLKEKIEIHGTVLAVNEENVFLKGGTKIPIRAISEVKVY